MKEKTKGGLGAAPAAEDQDDEAKPVDVIMIEVTLMQPYLVYMINKEFPDDLVEARRITWRSKAFVLIKGDLYNEASQVSSKDVSHSRKAN
jgi:hypothetical protein